MKNKQIAIIIMLLVLCSCANKRGAVNPDFPKMETAELVNKLSELSSLDWEFLAAKTNVKVVSEQQNNTFKASLRMKRDSAVLVNISFAAIPIIQAAISKDSLRIVNRKDKCYSIKDKSSLKQFIDFPIDYQQIEEILIGKPLLFQKKEEHIQVLNNDYYEIKTKRSRGGNKDNQIIITYYIAPKSLDLIKIKVESPFDLTTMEISYIGRHEKIEGLMLPQIIDIVIQNPKERITVNIGYNRPDVTNEKRINLNIPENYVICP